MGDRKLASITWSICVFPMYLLKHVEILRCLVSEIPHFNAETTLFQRVLFVFWNPELLRLGKVSSSSTAGSWVDNLVWERSLYGQGIIGFGKSKKGKKKKSIKPHRFMSFIVWGFLLVCFLVKAEYWLSKTAFVLLNFSVMLNFDYTS